MIHSKLERDYRGTLSDLATRFGVPFELASTGGGCYAIAGHVDGMQILITDSNDATLNPRAEALGLGVGIYADSETMEQVAYVCGGLDDAVALVESALSARA